MLGLTLADDFRIGVLEVLDFRIGVLEVLAAAEETFIEEVLAATDFLIGVAFFFFLSNAIFSLASLFQTFNIRASLTCFSILIDDITIAIEVALYAFIKTIICIVEGVECNAPRPTQGLLVQNKAGQT